MVSIVYLTFDFTFQYYELNRRDSVMGEHIRYNTNTSMATYLIGSTAIRYEYLAQILPPIVDKIQ